MSGGYFERTADGRLTWTAAFSSEGAGALRLHIAEASLPAGSRVYVYSATGEAYGPYTFDRGTRPEGFWTNTIFAPEAFLEVQFPAGAAAGFGDARLSVSSIIHLEHPGFAPGSGSGTYRTKAQQCFVDAACVTPAEFPAIEDAILGVAQLTFVDGGSAFVCTGGLLNSTPETFVPYLLTANHCFSTQAPATSLEAVWQYVRPSCNGPEPNPFGFPRTIGSTLRATGELSDFTLVELDEDPPDGSLFFGWTTADVTQNDGTILYRLSYPDGRPMFYTEERITANSDAGGMLRRAPGALCLREGCGRGHRRRELRVAALSREPPGRRAARRGVREQPERRLRRPRELLDRRRVSRVVPEPGTVHRAGGAGRLRRQRRRRSA